MATATFYIIQPDSEQTQETGLIRYAIYLAQHFASQNARVYINAHDKAQAESIDEMIWQLEPEQFQPHNLVGEGPHYSTMIEIGYSKLKPHRNRQLFINLANDHTNFAHTLAQVVDFVPCDEKAKQLARERYKIYRQAGYQMEKFDIQS
ncbi:MAG: DNA polymerase III subunit chi [Vibrio sp.]